VAGRARDVNLQCGAGAIEQDAPYFQLSRNELSSFDPDIRARAEAAGMPVVPRAVPVLPLTRILDRYSNGRPIDFLKIDVEGWEREALTGLDLQHYRPTVILVEATLPTTRIETHSKWEDILVRSNYAAVHFDGLSRFYLPNERMDLKSHFQLPPNIFDGFKTWQQANSETELGRFREEASRLRQDLAMVRYEAGKLSETLAKVRPASTDQDRAGNGSPPADPMTDHMAIDAIRRANQTLSSPRRLAIHALKAGMRSVRRRLSG
jgi:FkbM family methyltransferase